LIAQSQHLPNNASFLKLQFQAEVVYALKEPIIQDLLAQHAIQTVMLAMALQRVNAIIVNGGLLDGTEIPVLLAMLLVTIVLDQMRTNVAIVLQIIIILNGLQNAL